ncbi:thioesterase, FlK family, partial [Pseudonocardia sp. SID8383]|uniref:thioesterase, FlK family n=2 Tax=Pseudonocardia TaxID=1847 RepID=UPI001381C353
AGGAHAGALAVGLEVAALLAALPHLTEAEHAVSVSTAVTLSAQARRGREVAFRGTLDRRTGRSAFTSVTAVCDGVVVARAQVVKAVVGLQPG